MCNFEKSTKCILCDQNFKKSRLYVQFVGKDLKNMYQVAQKVQSERNWHHVRLGSTYTVT